MSKAKTKSAKRRGRPTNAELAARTQAATGGQQLSDNTPSGIAEPAMAQSQAGPSTGTGGTATKKRTRSGSKGTKQAHRSASRRGATKQSAAGARTGGEGLASGQALFTPGLAANMANIASSLWNPKNSVLNNRRAISAQFTRFVDQYNGPMV